MRASAAVSEIHSGSSSPRKKRLTPQDDEQRVMSDSIPGLGPGETHWLEMMRDELEWDLKRI